MREGKQSTTASLVAAVRALYSAMPSPPNLADDPLAERLVPPAYALPARLLRRLPARGGAHRIAGAATLGLTFHVELRTRAIDEALLDAVRRGTDQIVLLGAGLDSRAWRLGALARTRVFEVDHPGTQRHKRARLAGAAGAQDHVTFVGVDFERDRLDDALRRAGLAADRPSFWVWEGVTVYLTREAIQGTLRAIAALSAPTSQLVLSYVRPDRGRLFRAGLEAGRALLAAVGEPIRGMLTARELALALDRAGFVLLRDESALDQGPRYWGERPWGLREWERLALAERRAGPEGG